MGEFGMCEYCGAPLSDRELFLGVICDRCAEDEDEMLYGPADDDLYDEEAV